MAPDERHIDTFLLEFRQKKKIFGILFRDDRGKNQQTLLDLEISPKEREKVLDNLSVKDYVRGPLEDMLNKGPEMWEFGKKVKGQDVYIKITMGFTNSRVICISFHIAEYPLTYLFQ